MKSIVLTALFLSSFATASGGPEIVELTHSSAGDLGFTISTKKEGSSIQVVLKGPAQINDSCPASRSGVFLLDSQGQEIITYITELPVSQKQPEALGYYIDKGQTMGVFIDYLCSKGDIVLGKRYTVPSIGNWLITSKGKPT